MSSMRNAAPRRPHRERAQPAARMKWGLLEKHKDYSLRAADYNAKKAKLRVLETKRNARHPEEFAFGMLAPGSGKQGKHGRGDTAKNRLSHDVVERLKGQDAGHLRSMASRNRKEMEKTRAEIAVDGVMRKGLSGKKIVFDEDGEPLRKRAKLGISEDEEDGSVFDEVGHISSDGDEEFFAMDDLDHELDAGQGMQEKGQMPTPSDSETEVEAPRQKKKKELQREADFRARQKLEKRRRQRLREVRASKLEMLKKRQQSILSAAAELELQRARMSRTVGGVNRNGVKFKIRERKR